jgi:UbiD family decarboxylase
VANKDLRDWIAGIEAVGELKVIKGAEPKEEIGGFVDIYMRKMGNPAVMFDEVPGFPKGHRVIANILTSVPRINIALGLPPETTEIELTQWWRSYFKNAPSHPTKAVNGGPLLENVLSGARQAWPDHHAEISRARTEVPCRGDCRHASVDGHAGRHRDSLRQERA